MKKLISVVATAAALLGASAAHATVYKLDFTATGFGANPPQSTITGSIQYTAASPTAQVTAINNVDLTIAGHAFTAAEIQGALFGGPGYYIFNGVVNGVGIGSGTDDFWLRVNNGTFVDFSYARAGYANIWSTVSGTTAVNAVPEPGSLALLLAGAGILGAQLRRRRK